VYVIVWHELLDPPSAFERGQRLVQGEGAPSGTRVLQFYPAADGRSVTCLWESASVDDVQSYVDATLGDSSRNTCSALDATIAFAQLPAGIAPSAAAVAA
jgi:hypothetical protein